MNSPLRNILAVIAGWFVGSVVNMSIISFYPSIFPLPEQIIEGDMQSLIDNAHLLEIPNLISVFLAHGLGTLVGAFLAAKIGVSRHLLLSMIIGGLFLLGGIAINTMLNFTPPVFSIIDTFFAYIPMAWIGWKLSHPLKFAPSKEINGTIDGNLD